MFPVDSVEYFAFCQNYRSSLKLLSSLAVPASKSYTVAIIKPDAVAHGKANEIIMKVHKEDHCSHWEKKRLSQAFLLILIHYADADFLLDRFRMLALRSWRMRNAR